MIFLLLNIHRDLREGDVEPVRESFGGGEQQAADLIGRGEFIVHHLAAVWLHGAVILTDQYVIELVFGEAVVEFRAVGEAEHFFEVAVESHFFHEAAVSRGENVLIREGVAAAGIGPQSAGVVFVQRALLEQQFPFGIGDEHGKGAVEQAFLVGFQFFHCSDRFVLFIDQYDGR